MSPDRAIGCDLRSVRSAIARSEDTCDRRSQISGSSRRRKRDLLKKISILAFLVFWQTGLSSAIGCDRTAIGCDLKILRFDRISLRSQSLRLVSSSRGQCVTSEQTCLSLGCYRHDQALCPASAIKSRGQVSCFSSLVLFHWHVLRTFAPNWQIGAELPGSIPMAERGQIAPNIAPDL